jgi:hypothetical protein
MHALRGKYNIIRTCTKCQFAWSIPQADIDEAVIDKHLAKSDEYSKNHQPSVTVHNGETGREDPETDERCGEYVTRMDVSQREAGGQLKQHVSKDYIKLANRNFLNTRHIQNIITTF